MEYAMSQLKSQSDPFSSLTTEFTHTSHRGPQRAASCAETGARIACEYELISSYVTMLAWMLATSPDQLHGSID